MPHILKELAEGIKCFFYARRYGYRPIPSEIDTAELLKLRTTLVGMKNDVHLMDKWLVLKTYNVTVIFSQLSLCYLLARYRKDENKTPPESVLLPITTHLK